MSITETVSILNALYSIFPACFWERSDGSKYLIIDKLRALLSSGSSSSDLLPEVYGYQWPGKRLTRADSGSINVTLRPTNYAEWGSDPARHIRVHGNGLIALQCLSGSYARQAKIIHLRVRNEWSHADLYQRLFCVRTLLRPDGSLFVITDPFRAHEVRLLCDEVIGASNFISSFVSRISECGLQAHVYTFFYASSLQSIHVGRLSRTKEANDRYTNPDNDPRGVWKSGDLSAKTYSPANDYMIVTPSGRRVLPPPGRCWRLSREVFSHRVAENRIWFGRRGNAMPTMKRFLSELLNEGIVPTTWQVNHSTNIDFNRDLLKVGSMSYNDLAVVIGDGQYEMVRALLLENTSDLGQRRLLIIDDVTSDDTTFEMKSVKSKRESYLKYNKLVGFANLRSNAMGGGGGACVKNHNFSCRTLYLSTNLIFKDMQVRSLPVHGAVELKFDLRRANILTMLVAQMVQNSIPLTSGVRSEMLLGTEVYVIGECELVGCFSVGISLDVVKAIAAMAPDRVLFLEQCFRTDSEKLNAYGLLRHRCGWSVEESRRRLFTL